MSQRVKVLTVGAAIIRDGGDMVLGVSLCVPWPMRPNHRVRRLPRLPSPTTSVVEDGKGQRSVDSLIETPECILPNIELHS